MSSPAVESHGGGTSAGATSRTLLARVRARDPEAWERLVRLYAPFVLAGCRRAHLSREDASDVFQEVFQAAYLRIERFERRRPGDTFRGWLWTITRNKVIDHLRLLERQPRGVGGSEMARRLSGVRAPEASSTAPAQRDPAELRLLRVALESIRAHFHERTWRAFRGTVVDGRTPADVGEELGMSAGAVRVAKSRVLQRLRAELGDLG